ncbi:MAG: Ribosomal RNA small subunit methyltransferase F [Tenericutes bacterium ADurb.BinA155]|jgi:16S rRNA C967 or C1407 C5-methylase (RsmB/RsmF family)/NOL1/NOP2/fmu family ribosome biogenesis protein|nr:MAG: Ribosomal RNA small subunit methyltransferase F [Tenericutes bacterium ADurb.BinA155]
MNLAESLGNYLPKEEISSLEKALTAPAVHALLLNPEKISDEEFLRRFPHVKKHPFVSHAYLYDKAEYEFGQNLLYDDGAYSIQDPSAMMVPYFLNPTSDDIVLDMCAAPGGKTIGASVLMDNKGTIIANDISYPRAKDMSQNIERMGRGDIIVTSTDFVFAYVNFLNAFDKVILDAPCSGSAMFRKNEEAERDWNPSKVKSCVKRQLELLELSYAMLKEGGTLAYSTCSFSYEEDDGVILAFKAAHPEIELVSLPEDPSFYRTKELPEAVHLFPDHFEGEGQFVCLFKKPGVLSRNSHEVVANSQYKDFIAQYGLEGRSNEILRGKFYSLYQHFDASHLNILRYGVKLFEVREIFIPDHHLSHFVSSENSIAISEKEMKAYIHGDTFPTVLSDGFYIVSYDQQNLGFIKVTQGVAKNHYPKGLRREIK